MEIQVALHLAQYLDEFQWKVGESESEHEIQHHVALGFLPIYSSLRSDPPSLRKIQLVRIFVLHL